MVRPARRTHHGGLVRAFGTLRDDYTPKPAFTTFQHLIATASMR